MRKYKARLAGISAGLAIAVVAAYWYWSPYLDLRQMAEAARAKDAETFNAHVDYPRLRDSIKGQLTARMTDALPNEASGNVFAGIGAMIGMTLVNEVVDGMVRPEFVMRAMQLGRMPAPGAEAGSDQPTRSQPEWQFERSGVNRMIAYSAGPRSSSAPPPAPEERAVFVFERSGFAHWRLTELRLPETF